MFLKDGHAPANQLRLSYPGTDWVKPERKLGVAKPPRRNAYRTSGPPVGSSHGTAVYGLRTYGGVGGVSGRLLPLSRSVSLATMNTGYCQFPLLQR